MGIIIEPFFHSNTFTLVYLVYCNEQKRAAVIDPALDFDLSSGKVNTESCDEIIQFIKNNDLTLDWILETHAHADHLTAADYLKSQLGGQTAIGQDITFAQQTFKAKLNLAADFATDGRQFDKLLVDNDTLPLGAHHITAIHTPGHTNDSMTFVIDNNAFVGDTLFMPDSGTARCDFPGGDAALLFDSIQKIYALGEDTILWMCHDYQPNGRELAYKTSVAEQRANNIHLNHQTVKSDYVNLRTTRDATLSAPRLLYPSLQVNIAAGELPTPENNHTGYFKIPISSSFNSAR